MGFQILNAEGEAIPINKLDEIVAKFWGVEVQEKSYARPYKRTDFPKGIIGELQYYACGNWFDVIGWSIYASKTSGDWDLVKDYMEMSKESPYNKLLTYFKEKSYIPKSISS